MTNKGNYRGRSSETEPSTITRLCLSMVPELGSPRGACVDSRTECTDVPRRGLPICSVQCSEYILNFQQEPPLFNSLDVHGLPGGAGECWLVNALARCVDISTGYPVQTRDQMRFSPHGNAPTEHLLPVFQTPVEDIQSLNPRLLRPSHAWSSE